jgi:hypothetical protein
VLATRILAFTLAFFLAGLFSSQAFAQRKTDVVTLYNGDRITGEVKSLEGGLLRFSTDSMGTLEIEWQEIAQLHSKFYYEIRVGNGQRYFGSIEPATRPGQLLVQDLDGQQDLDWLQVVEVRPIEKNFVDRIELYLSAGLSYDRGSSITQTSLNTNISYENERGSTTLAGRSTATDSDDKNTSSSRLDLRRAIWTSHPKWFRALLGSYESNDELDLDYRFGAGGGFGRFILDSHKLRLVGIAGLQVITEQSQGAGKDQNLELILSSRFEMWEFNSPELELDFGFSLYPSLTDTGRLRSDSDLRLRWELIEDLFFDITAYGTWDSRAEGDTGLDYGVSTGLGWEF